MGKKGKILEYREILDKTLASPELTTHDSLQTLVRNQLLGFSFDKDDGCSENVIQKKTTEVSNFLDTLRSVSDTEHSEWKLKADNEEYRVMYRQGPHGTPFHTLLVEGYVDGPVDTCLCVSFESNLYTKWWPQLSFPPFKITMCKCLQKVRIGEHISLVRVKVTWPLSAREAVVHFFLFEYLKDGLVIVLLNSISDLDSIDRSTHGFTRDGIPEAEDVVRIDIVGGYAIQKVTSERSYFRTIATLDLKLDFVPPSLINFLSRQLIGSGFRLYQKVVAKESIYDEDYSKALKDPMYTRIREVLYSSVEPSRFTEETELKDDASVPIQEHSSNDVRKSCDKMEEYVQNIEKAKVTGNNTFGEIEEDDIGENRQLKAEFRANGQTVNIDDDTVDILENTSLAIDRKTIGEIEEEESEDSIVVENVDESSSEISTDRVAPKSPINYKAHISLSPEVEHALATLEKAISLVRDRVSSTPVRCSTGLTGGQYPNPQKNAETGTNSAEDGGVSSASEETIEVSEKGRSTERTSPESRRSSENVRIAGSNSCPKEVNHNKIAPASPQQYPLAETERSEASRSSKQGSRPSRNGSLEIPIVDLTNQDDKQTIIEANGMHEKSTNEEKTLTRPKKYWMRCFRLNLP